MPPIFDWWFLTSQEVKILLGNEQWKTIDQCVNSPLGRIRSADGETLEVYGGCLGIDGMHKGQSMVIVRENGSYSFLGIPDNGNYQAVQELIKKNIVPCPECRMCQEPPIINRWHERQSLADHPVNIGGS